MSFDINLINSYLQAHEPGKNWRLPTFDEKAQFPNILTVEVNPESHLLVSTAPNTLKIVQAQISRPLSPQQERLKIEELLKPFQNLKEITGTP